MTLSMPGTEYKLLTFLISKSSPMDSNSNSVASTSENTSKSEKTWAPEGFVSVVGPDDKEYMVPDFMVPALRQQYQTKKNREDLNAMGGLGTVSCKFSTQPKSILGLLSTDFRTR
jgi:hypothetical protein